ncbi:MAG: lysophospholipid acyltransferase family protein [Candidatus Babeliales bacterium]
MILMIVRSLLTYCIVTIVFIIAFIPCFVIACLPERWRYDNRVYYWFSNLVYSVAVYGSLVPVRVQGRENLPEQPAIIVANHQSAFDIPLLGFLLKGAPHIWLFLVRYAKIPVFGFIARRMNVTVDHSGLRKLVGSLDKAAAIVKSHESHVIIFPEGGRFNDGVVHRFFYGFAILAHKTKRPVIPIMMRNPGKTYPPGAFLIRPYPIDILIGEPFTIQEGETEESFLQRVHAWFDQYSGK